MILGGVIIFLLLTNPTLKDFKEFNGADRCGLKINIFLVCSTYRNNCVVFGWNTIYLGICKNFICISYQ
jgi:hypothetical protein